MIGRAVVTACVLAWGTQLARAEPPPARLDDPCTDSACSHHALDAFTAALAAQRGGTADHPLRISWFGDSLTADDQITDAVRHRLQAELGDGGPGFVFAIAPHPFCSHRAVTRVSGGHWLVYGVSTVTPPDRLLGLGGSAESDGDGTIRLVPSAHDVSSIDIDYLAQPGGGQLEVMADRTALTTVATADDHKHGAFARIEIPAGVHAIALRAAGRVRLFGASLEASAGAVVDNLGVVNATVKSLRHNLDDHWKNQLAHRDADLIVIMLGTNEAEWLHAGGAGMTEHEQVFDALLADVRTGNPRASCLVISPLGQLDWRTENMPPRTSVPAMVEAQRRAAAANGCAFWDAYRWMGGAGASRAWYARRLIMKDFQHPTTAGAELIGAALYAGLMSSPELAARRD
jgi:lysophospholipase L1-like esterase